MSEKNARGKAAKPRNGGEASVLGSLPSTRPTRMGRQREAAAGTSATAAPAAKPRAQAKPRTTAAKPRPAAAKPRAVRSGSPSLEPPARAPRRQPPPGPPKGTELVTTAVQAAGELAQIGVSLGGRMVKRAVGRLPKP